MVEKGEIAARKTALSRCDVFLAPRWPQFFLPLPSLVLKRRHFTESALWRRSRVRARGARQCSAMGPYPRLCATTWLVSAAASFRPRQAIHSTWQGISSARAHPWLTRALAMGGHGCARLVHLAFLTPSSPPPLSLAQMIFMLILVRVRLLFGAAPLVNIGNGFWYTFNYNILKSGLPLPCTA